MTMPFGKYKGLDVEELPHEYLEWLVDNVELRGRLLAAVERELGIHGGAHSRPHYKPAFVVAIELKPDQVRLARTVFDLGYKAAAMQAHPDTGGDTLTMQRLNALSASIRKQFVGLGAA